MAEYTRIAEMVRVKLRYKSERIKTVSPKVAFRAVSIPNKTVLRSTCNFQSLLET